MNSILVVWRFPLLKIGSVSVRFLNKNCGFRFFVTCDDTAIRVFCFFSCKSFLRVTFLWGVTQSCTAAQQWLRGRWGGQQGEWVSEWVSDHHWGMCGPRTRPLVGVDLQNFFESTNWHLILGTETRYPRRARSASAWILFSLWMYVCMYVCMYVSALERKRLIRMTWNSEP